MGNTGSSTGAHLHFEVSDRKGHPLNPEMFVGQTFASAEALPLKAASRFPRRVRVAYVSFIPKAKRELMEEREAEKELQKQELAALKAGKALASAKAAGSAPVVLDAPGMGDAEAAADPVRLPSGRVHATLEAAT